MGKRALLLAAVLLPAACDCGGDGPLLVVDLKTDLVPILEFDTIRTEQWRGEGGSGGTRVVVVEREAAADEDFLDGVRVAVLEEIAEGVSNVRVTLIDDGRQVVAERLAVVRVSGDTGVTVVITRSCRGVICPPAGEPNLATCESGRCVAPECTPETPESCPAGGVGDGGARDGGGPVVGGRCAVDADCGAAEGCLEPVCRSGVCLLSRVDARCAPGERCDPTLDCVDAEVCGDSTCEGAEDSCDCQEDCGQVCGDGCCNGDENTCGCPEDCGVQCGDRCCNGGEAAAGCPADCVSDCGDGTCAGSEDSCTCPADCHHVCQIQCCDGSAFTVGTATAEDCHLQYPFCHPHDRTLWMRFDDELVYERDEACGEARVPDPSEHNCFVHCCDGSVESVVVDTTGECRAQYTLCAANGCAESIEYMGVVVHARADAC